MQLTKTNEGSTLTIAVDGRIDTTTAPSLEEEINNSVAGITCLVLDFTNLAYISSAGLRVLLASQKLMNKQGKMIVRNVNQDVLDVLDITGFTDILTIE